MKTLSITINAEIQVPDDWELTEYPSGIQAIRSGDRYIEFDLTPLSTTSDDPEATWSDEDQALTSQILDSVTDWDVEMTLTRQH